MPVPAARFYWLLALGLAIAIGIAAAVDLAAAWTVLLVWDGGLALLAAIDGWRARGQRVELSRQPLGRLSVGRENAIALTLSAPGNPRDRQPRRVRVRDAAPAGFAPTPWQLDAAIAPGERATLTYTVRPDRRGTVTWGDLFLRQASPAGLAWVQRTVPARTEATVYPDLAGLRELTVRLVQGNAGTLPQRRHLGLGTEFAELRDYVRGDDRRAIDWKATARRGHPIVRVLEPEREQTVLVLLDRGRLMTARVQGVQRFDWGLNATLSLALAALNRGDRVGVGVFDRQVSTWIPPERGPHQLPKLIERLTPLQPDLLEPDYAGAVARLAEWQTRRALVVSITDVVDATASAELLSALARLAPRYLPFCVTLRDPLADRWAAGNPAAIAPQGTDGDREMPADGEQTGGRVSSGDAARSPTPRDRLDRVYARAVALDLLQQRELAFSRLRQRGVLVLDAPANAVSEELVDRYLQLKARGQL